MSGRRIVHLVESLEPWGTQRALSFVIGRLSTAEFEHVVVSTRGGALERQLRFAGAKVIKVGGGPMPSMAATVRAWREAHRQRPDVIHLWDDWSLRRVAMLLTLKSAAPIVCSLRNPPQGLDFGRRTAGRWVLARAAAIAANDPLVLQQTQAAYFGEMPTLADCRIIDDVGCGNPSDTSATSQRDAVLAEFQLASGTLLIGSASQLTQAKNLRDLIFAGALLRLVRNDFRLLICGDGPAAASVRRFNTLMQMDDLTIFTGERCDADRFVSALNVYVDCAAADGPARGIAEAQAAGVPVIGVDSSIRRRQIRPEIDGLLYPPNDPGALTRQLYHLLSDDELRARLGAAARAAAMSRPSRESIAAQYADFYWSVERRG